jgi:hypothetical protein
MTGRVAARPRNGPVEGVWGNREVPPRYRPRWRAMTIRCTSFVPSPISRIFWSR